MTRLDIVKAQSRKVVDGGPSATSETWSFTRLTSKLNANPRTYADPLDFQALPTRGNSRQEYDEIRQQWARIASNFVRCADNATGDTQLTQGDFVVDPAGKTWAVLGIASSGPGTVMYALGTEEILLGDPGRGGGT